MGYCIYCGNSVNVVHFMLKFWQSLKKCLQDCNQPEVSEAVVSSAYVVATAPAVDLSDSSSSRQFPDDPPGDIWISW